VSASRVNAVAFASGAVFSIGLLVSGMAKPGKVLGFLDFTGDWDPSLMLVMAGAIAVHFFFARRATAPGARPLLAEKYTLPTSTRLDAPLLGGAALFGIGWGLAGYCPGPALASIGSFAPATLAFVGAMAAGIVVMRFVRPSG
jgi:uncharacterized membrane protein YedE/YeeE